MKLPQLDEWYWFRLVQNPCWLRGRVVLVDPVNGYTSLEVPEPPSGDGYGIYHRFYYDLVSEAEYALVQATGGAL